MILRIMIVLTLLTGIVVSCSHSQSFNPEKYKHDNKPSPEIPVPAQSSETPSPEFIFEDADALKGIKSFEIKISDLSSDAIKEGLTAGKLKTDVEVKLRVAGIRVVNFGDKSTLTPDSIPTNMLHVDIDALKHKELGLYAIAIQIRVLDIVTFERQGKKYTAIATPIWYVGTLGLLGSNNFVDDTRDAAKDLIDQLINDYLKANPKE